MGAKRVLLLGSTGSIGESTLQVVDNLSPGYRLVALAAGSNWQRLMEQARRYAPERVAISDPRAAAQFQDALSAANLPRKPGVHAGREGLVSMVRETEGDIVVAAISGAAGLPANMAALETGKDLALANKESLVMTGAILTRLARERGRRILPVDSEHSAIFQSLQAGRHEEISSLILTASGGPFREATQDQLKRVTREQALKHPTWKMGAKITIDSATLMNKALEIIEARWLFDVPPEKIRVVIHPQSIIHSLVEFHDGSVISQMGHPDMKVPIQYALTYPRREPLPVRRLELEKVGVLTFHAPDPARFPAIRLAYEVLRAGGTAPAVFNAANEAAVAAFLREEIGFTDILWGVEETLRRHEVVADPTLEEIFGADSWARDETLRQIQLRQQKLE